MKSANTLITAAMAALLSVFVMVGCKDQESMADVAGNDREAPAIPVAVTVIEPVAIQDVVFLPGETEAYEDVKVAANTSGRVEWIGPREGQSVKKGDLLAKIDVSALRASLEHAQAAYELADDLYRRRRRLLGHRGVLRVSRRM